MRFTRTKAVLVALLFHVGIRVLWSDNPSAVGGPMATGLLLLMLAVPVASAMDWVQRPRVPKDLVVTFR